jgi:hypothetical protein
VQWRERGAPRYANRIARAFGLRLVTEVLRNGQVGLSFDRVGLVCEMLIEIDES